MNASSHDQPALQYSDEDARNFIDCWCPIPVRAYIARLAAGEPANIAIATDLFDRIEHAISRVTHGETAMRVPADSTDPDLVLAECRDLLSALLRQSQDMALVPIGEIERAVKAMRYAAHPRPSPNADALAKYLSAAPLQQEQPR